MPGITQKTLDSLASEIGPDSAWTLLRSLRSLKRDRAASVLKNLPKGKLNSSIRSVLDALYAMPMITVSEARVFHKVDKTSGRSYGTLKIGIDIDHRSEKTKGRDDSTSLSLVLGSFERHLLLGFAQVTVSSQGGRRHIEKEIVFDWASANADGGEGGGLVVLRMFLDRFRGMDSELTIKLK